MRRQGSESQGRVGKCPVIGFDIPSVMLYYRVSRQSQSLYFLNPRNVFTGCLRIGRRRMDCQNRLTSDIHIPRDMKPFERLETSPSSSTIVSNTQRGRTERNCTVPLTKKEMQWSCSSIFRIIIVRHRIVPQLLQRSICRFQQIRLIGLLELSLLTEEIRSVEVVMGFVPRIP